MKVRVAFTYDIPKACERRLKMLYDCKIAEVATATGNPTISVKNRQNHLINSPNGAMNGDA